MADITLEAIIERLDDFSDNELEKLAHEIRVILDSRDENYAASLQRRKMSVEECIDEMICKLCGHELDCFCGCSCLCHEMV